MSRARRHLAALSDLQSLQALKCMVAEHRYFDAVIALKDQREVREQADNKVNATVIEWQAFWSSRDRDPRWLPTLSNQVRQAQDQAELEAQKQSRLAADVQTAAAASYREEQALRSVTKRQNRAARRRIQTRDDRRIELRRSSQEAQL